MTRKRQLVWMLAAAALLFGLAFATCQGARGCRRHEGPEYAEETASWLAAVQSLGGNGMWLVTRGYHLGDDFIAMASNSPFSHASVVDLERGEVIEAVAGGVVATPIEKFLRECHRLQIIRPDRWDPQRGAAAVARARGAIGKSYDLFGIVGAPSSDHFYCSELALWSMGVAVDHKGPHKVVHPRHMDRHGDLLFDSRDRDGQPDF